MQVTVHMPKPIEYTTSRMSSNVICGLWMPAMSQCRFIHGNTCTTLVGNIDNGEAVYMWEQRLYGESLDLPQILM